MGSLKIEGKYFKFTIDLRFDPPEMGNLMTSVFFHRFGHCTKHVSWLFEGRMFLFSFEKGTQLEKNGEPFGFFKLLSFGLGR